MKYHYIFMVVNNKIFMTLKFYTLHILPPVGQDVITGLNSETIGIELKNQYDDFKSKNLMIIDEIEQYKCHPVDYFTDHIRITSKESKINGRSKRK